MNEDYVLENAISYKKRLQDHANMLKEQIKNDSQEEPVVYVSKTWVLRNDDGTSSSTFYHESSYQTKQSLPEIEAKAQGKDVLIRVHCENQNGYLTKVVGEIEKLHLIVDNINALPFRNHYLDITITAQMSDDFCMTMKDFKRNLRQALLSIM